MCTLSATVQHNPQHLTSTIQLHCTTQNGQSCRSGARVSILEGECVYTHGMISLTDFRGSQQSGQAEGEHCRRAPKGPGTCPHARTQHIRMLKCTAMAHKSFTCLLQAEVELALSLVRAIPPGGAAQVPNVPYTQYSTQYCTHSTVHSTVHLAPAQVVGPCVVEVVRWWLGYAARPEVSQQTPRRFAIRTQIQNTHRRQFCSGYLVDLLPNCPVLSGAVIRQAGLGWPWRRADRILGQVFGPKVRAN
jgi:hypothetical protein